MALWHQYWDKSQIFQLDENQQNFLCLSIEINKWEKSKKKQTDPNDSFLIDALISNDSESKIINHSLELINSKKDNQVVSFLNENESTILNKVSFIVCNIREVAQEFNSELKTIIFVKHERPDNPSLLEKSFKNIKSQGYAGVAFSVEEITRGYVALAHKFDLKVAITSVKHERHLQKAQSCSADEIVLI